MSNTVNNGKSTTKKITSYAEQSKENLQKKAEELKIKDSSKMSKEELVSALEKQK